MNAKTSIKKLAGDYLAGSSLTHILWLCFDGCRLQFKSDSAALIENLRSYYQGFECEEGPVDIVMQALERPSITLKMALEVKKPDPGKERIKEEFIDLTGGRLVRKRLTGMVFVFGEGINLAIGPCLANDNQVVNFINSRYIQWLLEREYLLCHAASVASPKGGLALAGFSGMGKSTLALHLMSQGLNFISNDRLLIKPRASGLIMQGVAKLPRINPGTALSNPDLQSVIPGEDRQRFGELPPDSLWTLEHKYDVHLDRCFGPGRFQLSSNLRAVVIINWREKGGSCCWQEVDLSQRPDLLGAVMKSPGLFYLPQNGQLADVSPQAYVAALASCPSYELTGSPDFSKATAFCLDLLNRAGQTGGPGFGDS